MAQVSITLFSEGAHLRLALQLVQDDRRRGLGRDGDSEGDGQLDGLAPARLLIRSYSRRSRSRHRRSTRRAGYRARRRRDLEGVGASRGSETQAALSDSSLFAQTVSVNQMAQNLTLQVREIASVTKAVADGDLSKTVDIGASGEIRELKMTVNSMVSCCSEPGSSPPDRRLTVPFAGRPITKVRRRGDSSRARGRYRRPTGRHRRR